MNVELSKNEIELLEQALVTWEQEAMQQGMMGAIFGAMIPGGEKEERKKAVHNEIEVAKQESQKRRMKSTMLRAKLIQALSRDSEHTIET
jgi:hypothetical protein